MSEAGVPQIKISILMDGQDFSEFVKKCDGLGRRLSVALAPEGSRAAVSITNIYNRLSSINVTAWPALVLTRTHDDQGGKHQVRNGNGATVLHRAV